MSTRNSITNVIGCAGSCRRLTSGRGANRFDSQAGSPRSRTTPGREGPAMPVTSRFEGYGSSQRPNLCKVGGDNESEAIANTQIYNPVANAWSTGPDLPTATGQAASAVVKNILYVIGGSDNEGGNLFQRGVGLQPEDESMDLKKSPMPTAR